MRCVDMDVALSKEMREWAIEEGLLIWNEKDKILKIPDEKVDHIQRFRAFLDAIREAVMEMKNKGDDEHE